MQQILIKKLKKVSITKPLNEMDEGETMIGFIDNGTKPTPKKMFSILPTNGESDLINMGEVFSLFPDNIFMVENGDMYEWSYYLGDTNDIKVGDVVELKKDAQKTLKSIHWDHAIVRDLSNDRDEARIEANINGVPFAFWEFIDKLQISKKSLNYARNNERTSTI